MARGFPSMTALLGLLAVAGYQHRDKLGELLGGRQQDPPAKRPPGAGEPSSGLDRWRGSAGPAASGGVGAILGRGLSELIDRFRQSGEGETADSWVAPGPNRSLSAPQLERAVGPEVLETLSQQTGLTRDELLARLSRDLPDAVDRYTPDGRLPPDADPPRA